MPSPSSIRLPGIPVESERAVVVYLILVLDLELVRQSYPRDTHEGIVIGELSGGEVDRVSEIVRHFLVHS